jgi:hypothetical protein
LRLNAVAVSNYPKSARLVHCDIGGAADVKRAVEEAKVPVIATRRRDGVIGFGRDDDLLAAFRDRDPKLDYGQLDATKSADLGLLYDAILQALTRQRPLIPRGRRILIVDPQKANDVTFDALRRAGLKQLYGRIPSSTGIWAEGIELRLEQRHGALWLIYAPTVWSDRGDDKEENDRRREWTREYQVKRYNRPYTAILKGWADVLCESQKETTVKAFGFDRGGADAEFVLKRLAPFAERQAS